jgi:3-oxoacyl-[acyl-carrier-protein] synthase III
MSPPGERAPAGGGRPAPPRPAAALTGVGYAVPDTVVANAAIAERLGVEESWIASRTGTHERRALAAGERLEDLAARAGAAALADAGVDPRSVDLLLVATTSADEMSPHTAALVAGRLGAAGSGAVDVSAACTGFLSALSLAAGAIEAGRARTVLVVGADALTPYLDADDRGSAMLFGDGAGAVVVRGDGGAAGIAPVLLHSDATGRDLIRLARQEARIRMDGPEVYRRAVGLMVEVTREALEAAGLGLEDIDLFVYHQANSRILRAVGDKLDLDPEKVVDVIARFANTSAASLPIALAVAVEEGRLAPGDRVLLAAFGAGLVWGGGVVTWGAGVA